MIIFSDRITFDSKKGWRFFTMSANRNINFGAGKKYNY